jgi:hypothetical protein
MMSTIEALFAETEQSAVDTVRVARFGTQCMLEQFLDGEEITITVMPPGEYTTPTTTPSAIVPRTTHWTLPPVRRTNHINGVLPYTGKQVAADNSTAIDLDLCTPSQRACLLEAMEACARAGALMQARAPLRIDCRAAAGPDNGAFYLFDVNLKPNLTSPGRNASRAHTTNLCLMAALKFGWSNEEFLYNILRQAWSVGGDQKQ